MSSSAIQPTGPSDAIHAGWADPVVRRTTVIHDQVAVVLEPQTSVHVQVAAARGDVAVPNVVVRLAVELAGLML